MKLHKNTSLRAFNSFGVEAQSRRLLEITAESDLPALYENQGFDYQNDMVLGGGSNVLFRGNFPGTVLLNRISGYQVIERTDNHSIVECASGEQWHRLVRRTLKEGLYGLENLSLIPGLAGAAPMQNIGAYGVELSQHLESLKAFDWQTGNWRRFSNQECGFAYRDSYFKSSEPGRFTITSIQLKLSYSAELSLDYRGVSEALQEKGITNPTPIDVSDTICEIRQRKLPDPSTIGNAGSFFKNPVVNQALAEALKANHPDLPCFTQANGQYKLSAGWLIEQCGWKGFRDGDAGVSPDHALVLVNHGHAQGREIADLATKIQQDVLTRFGVKLIPEPKLIPVE